MKLFWNFFNLRFALIVNSFIQTRFKVSHESFVAFFLDLTKGH